MMTILEGLDDPDLFAPHFRGDTWDRWRVFLAALFALPMDDADLDIYRCHTARQEAPTRPFTEAALICGRRGGKSRVLALVAVYLACFRKYEEHLAPGEVATIAVIAADRKQARSIFRYCSGLLDTVPMLKAMVAETGAETVRLTNRVQIEIATASFRVARGYTYGAVLADEVAFWRSEESANPDREIVDAIRPGLATIPGAMLLLASSPYRRAGVLWSSFRRHFGRDDARVLVWRGTTREMNPKVDPAVIAEAYEEDPASAGSEYGAEFRDDLQDFVAREVVEACTEPGRFELPKITGVNYRAFVDPSGGSSDSMTLAIAHRSGDTGVLDVIREWKPPFSPEAVVKEAVATLQAYGLYRVTGDRYGGEWPPERFREHGIQYEPSERSKSEIYRDVLPLLNSRKLELLDNARLTSQLCSLERRTARGGRDSIDHPPGGHDDVANAAAGALLLVAGKADPLAVWLKL